MKKTVSLLLVLVMVLAFIPVFAGAAYTPNYTLSANFTQNVSPLELEYTGKELKPAVTVSMSYYTWTRYGTRKVTTPLSLGRDYVVTYSNNVNVTTEKAPATATVTFINGYAYNKAIVLNFNILPKPLTDKTISIEAIADQIFTGEEIKPIITVKDRLKKLELDVDYTVAYAENIDAGTATVTVTGIGNYKDMAETATFKILPKSVKENSITVADIADRTYTGAEIKPVVVVKDGETVLKLDEDYTVAYTNNINAGTATVTVTGIGNYDEVIEKTFTINPKNLASKDISVGSLTARLFTGSAITPTVTVKDGRTTLSLNKDYTVSYSNNVGLGTATVTITGTGNYTGSVKTYFTIYSGYTYTPSIYTFGRGIFNFFRF